MQKNIDTETRSFRLTTKKKISARCFSEQKSDSSSSDQNLSFTSEYNLLTKRLKIKASKLKNHLMGSTVSSFDRLSSFRVRTQSSHSKQMQQKTAINLMYTPISPVNRVTEQADGLDHRYSSNIAKGTVKLRFSTQTRPRKNFRIQKPSIYWQMAEEQNELSLLNKQNKSESQLAFSPESSKLKVKFIQNCLLLWSVRKQMSKQDKKIKPKDVIKAIKSYIMRKQQDSNKSLQKILLQNQQQNDLKQIIACERAIIIGIVELINIERLHHICVQCITIIDNLIGLYYHLLKGMFSNKPKFYESSNGYKQFEQLSNEIESEQLQQKKSLSSTLLYLYTKFQVVYRFSPSLLSKVKSIIANVKKCSINRTFYDLLTVFAVYLNYECTGVMGANNSNYLSKYIASFTTCPSPFIVEPRKSKKYSLVIDLDQTLLYAKFQAGSLTKYSVKYRPHYKQFLTNLSEHYQIIIFTSSMADYAEQVGKPFSYIIVHILCREHTLKVNGGTIKDIARIGRSLDSTILIDNMQQNLRLQPDNGILIKSWYGDKNDNQLIKLEEMLVEVAEKGADDVRVALKEVLNKGPLTP